MKVLNLKLTANINYETAVYIGRPKGNVKFHFGNPFSHRADTKASVVVPTRKEAVEAFQDWLDGTRFQQIEPERRVWILTNLHLLKGKNLVCWCAPAQCHGDVLIHMANQENN